MRQGETYDTFHARVWAELSALTGQYNAWQRDQGLNLGSADEHLFDENLTEAQKKWLQDFSQRWEVAEQGR